MSKAKAETATIPQDAIVHRAVQVLDVDQIGPSRFEPQARRRARFKKEDTDRLGESILKSGLEQPILVRAIKPLDVDFKKSFEIVFGERRWLAHKAKNLKTIECFVKELSDAEVIERQYQENHERQDNDPLDDAFYFKFLQDTEDYSVQDLSIKFNISQKAVVNKLKFNDLIDEAKEELSEGLLPLGHALYLSKFPAEIQKEIVERKFAYRWTSREDGATPLAQFKDKVNDNLLCNLSTAVFDTEDTRLHLKGLTCSECPERSGFSPMLFADIIQDDSCLNSKCFQAKTNVHLILKREEIADHYAKVGDYLDVVVKKVPLVTERYWISRDEIPFSDVKHEDVLTSQKLYETAECESSMPALAVFSSKKGEKVYICQNKKCEVHNPTAESETDEPEGLTSFEKAGLEQKFNLNIAQTVRDKIFAESLKYFESGSFWQYADLVDELIIRSIFNRRFYLKELTSALQHFPNLPKNFDDTNKNREFVEKLELFQKSQLLFLITYCDEGFMNWRVEPQDGVAEIANDFAKLNYRLLDAQTRVELAPEEFKLEVKKYLAEVENGYAVDPPHLWWKEEPDADTEDED